MAKFFGQLILLKYDATLSAVSADLRLEQGMVIGVLVLTPVATVPLILALVPATVTTAVRTLMSDLNELRSRSVEDQANARILALELYLKNKNHGHGVGFVAFELVLDRRMLKQAAVVAYGLTAAALTM